MSTTLKELYRTRIGIETAILNHLSTLPPDRVAEMERNDRLFVETGDTPSEYMLYCLTLADFMQRDI